LLEILEKRGYNVKPYSKFGPFEIEKMLSKGGELALRMDLEKTNDDVEPTKCRVEYAFHVKSRLASFIKKLIENDKGEPIIDSETTEIIIITREAIGDSFNSAAISALKNKLRLRFFDASTLVSNPMNHVLVPKHEILPESMHKEFLTKYYIESKNTLPIIKFHEDIIGRILGLVPGNIVKITRPSPQAGEYITYRICAP